MSAAATPPTINGSISPALHMPPVFIPLDECVRLADAGDAEAQFQLGLRYVLPRSERGRFTVNLRVPSAC